MNSDTATKGRKTAEVSESTLNDLLTKYGFEKCDFGPERGDHCDVCDNDCTQLYFQGDGFGEGCYWCEKCLVDYDKENKDYEREINALETYGHEQHCASRIVFGDGTC